MSSPFAYRSGRGSARALFVLAMGLGLAGLTLSACSESGGAVGPGTSEREVIFLPQFNPAGAAVPEPDRVAVRVRDGGGESVAAVDTGYVAGPLTMRLTVRNDEPFQGRAEMELYAGEVAVWGGATEALVVEAGPSPLQVELVMAAGGLQAMGVTGVTTEAPGGPFQNGDTVRLGAVVAGVEGAPVYWGVLDPGVASIQDGLATSLAPGAARFVALAGTHADTSALFFDARPERVTILGTIPDTLFPGETLLLTAEVRDETGTVRPDMGALWRSSDESVAVVTEGRVDAAGVGEAWIAVRALSPSGSPTGVEDSALVRVHRRPPSERRVDVSLVRVDHGATVPDGEGAGILFRQEGGVLDMDLYLGGRTDGFSFTVGFRDGQAARGRLEVKLYQYGPSPAWVGVVEDFLVEVDTATATLELDVVPGSLASLAVTGLELADVDYPVYAGASTVVTPLVQGDTTAPVFWGALDPGVATVTDGRVTGLAPGAGRVVAASGHRADTTAVAVIDPPDSLEIAQGGVPFAGYLTLAVGDTAAFDAIVWDARGAEMDSVAAPVRWGARDSTVVAVEGGIVRAVRTGQTEIEALVVDPRLQPSIWAFDRILVVVK